MDLVLGLSMTSTAVRWVLVDGTTGGGAPLDRGALDTAATAFDADRLLDALLDDNENLADSTVYAVGVTWTSDADAEASTLLETLAARGLENVVSVSEIEAAEALAGGIAEIAGYDDVAVSIFEPDAALVAVVNAEGVTVDRIDRSVDGTDAADLTSSVIALDLNDRQLDAIFVVGSDDLDPVVSTLEALAAAPVITAAEADLAMARGAAVASALAVNTLEADAAPVRRLSISRTGVLATVLAAAVVVFIVSMSAALGLRLTPDSGSEQPQIARAADDPAPVTSSPSVARAAPKLPRPLAKPSAPPPNARMMVAQTMVVAAPPAPVYRPPAPTAPAPAVVPPPPPVYVPPVVPKPRLRDRIIERIPIINRFHEPEYQYPGR